MKIKWTLILVCLITLFISLLPGFAVSNCYIIDGLGTTTASASQGKQVGIYATVNNCFSESKRMYVQVVVISACGETATVFTSDAKNYRSMESKYFYTNWKVPYGYSMLPFGGTAICKGKAKVNMTVYSKNFWGTSRYISSASTTLTIK